MQTKRENRGGKRQGSGRKSVLVISDEQKKALLLSIKKVAKKANRSDQWEILAEMIFAHEDYEDITHRDQLTAIKLSADLLIAKNSEKDVSINEHTEPQIFLPEKKAQILNMVRTNEQQESKKA